MTDSEVTVAHLRYERARLALTVATAVLLLAAVGLLLAGNQRAEEQRALTLAQTSLLVECTTAPADRVPPVDPSPEDCYLRGQARTSAAVAQIGDLSIVAAACGAAHPGDVPATRGCVEAALDRASR